MDILSAPSNFLVQWLRNFESKDLGSRSPSPWFSRKAPISGANGSASSGTRFSKDGNRFGKRSHEGLGRRHI